MFQLYGLSQTKIITPAYVFPETQGKAGILGIREVIYVTDIYKELVVTNPLALGNQVVDGATFGAGYVYTLKSIGFWYVTGTITINKISIKNNLQLFYLAGSAALAQNVLQVWNGDVTVPASSNVHLDVTVTVVNPTITLSIIGYRTPIIP